MLTKEKFKELVYLMLEHNEFYDKLYDLGIDVISCKPLETSGIIFDELMKSEFGVDGADLVSWWMYEDVDHKLFKTVENRKEWYYPEEKIEGELLADLNNIDDLYDYLTERGRDE